MPVKQKLYYHILNEETGEVYASTPDSLKQAVRMYQAKKYWHLPTKLISARKHYKDHMPDFDRIVYGIDVSPKQKKKLNVCKSTS